MPSISTFTSDEAREHYDETYRAALAALPPHTIEHVDSEFGSIQALSLGPDTGVPIVLLHGMSCTSAMWAPNLGTLAANRRVIALDTVVDCGGSRQSSPVTNRTEVVLSASQALRELGVTRAHIVGLSYGAWIAAGLALDKPDMVASLSLLEPAGTIHRIKVAYILGLLKSFVRSTPRRWDFLFRRRPTDALIALLDASRGFTPHAPLPKPLADGELRRLAMPTQVILGRQSTTCDARRTEEKLRLLPRPTALHVLERAGHIVSVDQPEQVNSLLLDFIGNQD